MLPAGFVQNHRKPTCKSLIIAGRTSHDLGLNLLVACSELRPKPGKFIGGVRLRPAVGFEEPLGHLTLVACGFVAHGCQAGRDRLSAYP